MPPIYEIPLEEFPKSLREIPQPPKRLYARGYVDIRNKKVLTVVGPRQHSHYGADCTRSLIAGLRDLPVVIVSGLAYGIDSIAHEAALDAGLPTIAFPGSGLGEKVIYPRKHLKLAERILEHGGMLISEFASYEHALEWMFPQRNRLVAGIAHAVLIPEAGEKSGTLITAKLTVDYNRDLLVVPGNITSPTSKGANQFLRLGATPVTCIDDLREALGFERNDEQIIINKIDLNLWESNLDANEKKILTALSVPKTKDELSRECDIHSPELNVALSHLELYSLIRNENGIISPVYTVT